MKVQKKDIALERKTMRKYVKGKFFFDTEVKKKRVVFFFFTGN